MLANHVIAQFARFIDVEFHRLVARSRVEPVGPPPLVERPVVEDCLIVEGEAHDAFCIGALANFAHCSVALHRIDYLAVALQGEPQVVEMRVGGRPKLHVGGHIHFDWPTGAGAFGGRYFPAFVVDIYRCRSAVGVARGVGPDDKSAVVDVGSDS